MAERPVDPKVAEALFRILYDHLSDDPEGRDILAQLEQDPDEGGEGLDDYLRHRLDADDALVETLAAVPGVPASVRADVSGGHVEKLIQIARAGTVQVIVQPRVQRGRRFWAGLAAVAMVIVGGLIGVWLSLNQLPPMPSGFNVAVAEFAMLDASGRTTLTDDTKELSVWLFEAIKKETDQLPASLRINIRGPDEVGIIAGEDSDTRAANAAQVAARHNATILIYGVVTAADDNGYQVEPEFYVSDQSFGYGSEVAGPDRLGQPVSFTLPLEPGEQVDINEKLNARTQALQHLVAGLAYFYIGHYDEARDKFQRAADVEGWRPEEGKEIAYLLIGAANLRLYDQKNDPAQRSQALTEALEAFEQASQLNPDYARSYLGLGAVVFQQARNRDSEGNLTGRADEAKLIEAREWYSKSLTVSDQPASAYVPVKAAYGLGQVHLVGFEQGSSGWSGAEAWRFFEQVTTAYEAKQVPDLAWLASHAHAQLGRLAGHNKDWQTMSSEFRKAIDILSSLPGDSPRNWIARYWSWVAFAEEKLDRLDAARDAYREAIRLGEGNVPLGELEDWQDRLDRLEKGAS